jgi:hypothetical protein
MPNGTPVSTLRIGLTVYADAPSGFGADVTVDAHGFHAYVKGRTAHSAARNAITKALDTVPHWQSFDHGLRRGLEERLATSLRQTGATRTANELTATSSVHQLRALSLRAVRDDGAHPTEGAAIALLADLAEADGIAEHQTLEALLRLVDHPPTNAHPAA